MSFESWLRSQIGNLPVQAPPAEQALTSIAARIRRRRTVRRSAAAAGVAAVLSISAGAVTLFTHTTSPLPPPPAASDSATPAIPWVDTPGTKFQPSQGVQKDWPTCAGSDVEIRPGLQGAWHGNATQGFVLTNRSSNGCQLATPNIHARTATADQPVDPGPFADTRIPLGPGFTSELVIGAPADCAPTPGSWARSATVAIGSSAPQTVPDVTLSLACGAPSVLIFQSDQTPASTDPRADLEASWEGPSSVRAGEVLEYVIALHNPTGEAISLEPCPSYTQGAEDLTVQTLKLNCTDETTTTIAPGGTERFKMKMTIPATATQPQLKVGWHLEVDQGPLAGAVLTVDN